MSQDFKLVTYKKGRKQIKTDISNTHLHKLIVNNDFDRNIAIKRVIEAQEEILSSDLFDSTLASLREGLDALNNPIIKEIICFGLGRIGECLISRYQFAFLLCLKKLYSTEIIVFDPVFTQNEIALLNHFNCNVLSLNCEAKYKVNNCTTIFYLPHCPHQLSNNLLWANWGLQLSHCIIISNSFHNIIDNTSKNILNTKAQYIQNIVPYVLELAIINTFRFNEIFNDTAIHVFPLKNINLLSNDFWFHNEEPIYPVDDLEYISNNTETNR